MIKKFPKILISFGLSIIMIFLIIIVRINFLNLDNESVGYYSLFLSFIILYILIPLQLIFISIKIIFYLWRQFNDK